MRLGTKPAARTPSPPLVRRASVADRTLASGSMVRARTNTALAMELAWGVVDAKGKASSEPTEKTPSPKAEPADAGRRSSPTIPQLQSRISDIDREIAECKERLVQMSSTAVAAEQSAASEESKRVPGDDRAVPTSPPFKQAIAPVKDSMRAGAEVAAALVQKCVPGADLAALVVPQTAAGKSDVAEQPRKKASPGPHSDGEQSAAEGSGPEDGDGPRLEEKDMMQTIYHENQARAAAENARFAAPFLECWPTFVPGTYAEPADWPFWEESGRIHEQIKPHLAMILAREKLQAQSHRLRLQREYSTLYAKWRRRVDRLDRQREQRQTVGTTPTPSGAFGTGYRRRAGPANSVDEFGFSLGALFSATPVVDAADDPFKSDAVHSEAELMAIIERLQHDDARNPDLRSQRTAAIIPDMVADPKQRVLLQFNNSSHLIEDPMTFYHAKVPEAGTSQHKRVAYANNGDTGRYWTQAEASAFVTAYLTYPKQFGKIAAHIPHKTMNDCVLFYYRNKKPLRLKELEAKANRAARRSRQTTSSRRRKERERRARKTQEERERLAMEAAAECAPTDHS
ncbi:DNA-binding protein snt1, partial [Coemansia biformis]